MLAVRELVALGYRVGVYKPIASGCTGEDQDLQASDAIKLWEASGQRHLLDQVCPQRFRGELAPHLAARLVGKQVNEALLIDGLYAVAQDVDYVVVEGAGGLMSPLSENLLNSSLCKRLDAHLILVIAKSTGSDPSGAGNGDGCRHDAIASGWHDLESSDTASGCSRRRKCRSDFAIHRCTDLEPMRLPM